MAGEYLFAVTASELKEIRKDPARAKKLDRNKHRHADIGTEGYYIEAALAYLADEGGLSNIEVAVSGFMSGGDPGFPLSYMDSKRVRETALALPLVSKDMFKEACGCSAAGCDEDAIEDMHRIFKHMAEFFEDAARARRSVVRFMY